jgi:hypothetical protein
LLEGLTEIIRLHKTGGASLLSRESELVLKIITGFMEILIQMVNPVFDQVSMFLGTLPDTAGGVTIALAAGATVYSAGRRPAVMKIRLFRLI